MVRRQTCVALAPMFPVELEAHGHLSASAARVWARLVDGAAISSWCEPVRSLAADGDRLLLHLVGAGARDWVDGQVVSVEPRRRLDVRLRAPTAQLRQVRVEVELEQTDDGTDFSLRVTVTPNLLGNLAVPLRRLGWEVTMARAVRGFRAALEAHEVAGSTVVEDVCRERHVPPSEAARLAATAAV